MLASVPEFKQRNKYAFYCPVKVNGLKAFALLDSGNLCSNAISLKFAEKLGYTVEDIKPLAQMSEVGTAKSGATLKVCGLLPKPLRLQFGGHPTLFRTRPLVIDGLSMNLNISGPFMAKAGLDQIHSRNALSVQGHLIPLLKPGLNRTLASLQEVEKSISHAYLEEDVTIPARSAKYVCLRVPAVEDGTMFPGDGLIEPHAHFVESTDVHPTLCALSSVSPNGLTYSSVLNTNDEEITIKKGQRFGTFSKNVCIHALDCNVSPSESIIQAPNGAKGRRRKRRNAEVGKESRNLFTREELKDVLKLSEAPMINGDREMNRALDLLYEYRGLFSVNREYGHTDLVEMEINTTESAPIRCKTRPINPALEPNLREQIDLWLKEDVIEPSSSPWNSPLLAVPKKNGKTRWVADFRALNQCTVKDAFPLPHIEDNLTRLSKSRIFSALDGTGAYHVVSIREKDREKTAFSTPWGHFHFKRMPFGLANAPSVYSRLVQKVLEGIPPEVATIYLDDTAVHSRNFEEHLKSLTRVFDAYQRGGLMLNPEKCQFFRDSIEYLGHVVSEKGISVPPAYTEIVRNWPYPRTISDVRTFLGKISYYRKFIPRFSHVASPLLDFVKQDQVEPIPETEEAKKAFEDLKEKLVTAPILAYPQFDGEPFIVDCDWSKDALGGVLSQVQDGQERVIAYGARRTNKAERNYSSNKGELAAVIHFLKTWRYYLLHRKFILRSDHQSLKWIRTMQEPQGMILRWLDILANYDFDMEFRSGAKHGNADALSRTTHGSFTPEDEDPEGEKAQSLLAPLVMPYNKAGIMELKKEQEKDDVLSRVMEFIRCDKWPQEPEIRSLDPFLRLYIGLRSQLSINPNGILVRTKEFPGKGNKEVFCVPRSMQALVMRQCHNDALHRGENGTLAQTANRFFFPAMAAQAHITIQQCKVCQKNKPAPKHQRHTLISFADSHPFNRLSLDFVGPMRESNNGNRYILTVRCCFTRWIEAFPTNDLKASTVARLLEENIFSRYGLPETIHTDRGANFLSSLLKEVYAHLNIYRTMTPAFSPQSNSIERSHRDLGQLLRASIDEHGQDWEESLPACLWAMRIATNRSTGFSPFFLVFGRDPVMELDLLYGVPKQEKYGPIEYANLLRKRLNDTFKIARENMQTSITRAKHQYREVVGGEKLKDGDLVWLFTPSLTQKLGRKLSSVWTGPWKVLEVISPVLIRIRVEGTWNKLALESVVAVDRLRRYTCTDPPEVELDLRSEDINPDDEFAESHDFSSNASSSPGSRLPPSGALPMAGGFSGGSSSDPDPNPDPEPPEPAPSPPPPINYPINFPPKSPAPPEPMEGTADPHSSVDSRSKAESMKTVNDENENASENESTTVENKVANSDYRNFRVTKVLPDVSMNESSDNESERNERTDDSRLEDSSFEEDESQSKLEAGHGSQKYEFKRSKSPEWTGLQDALPPIKEESESSPRALGAKPKRVREKGPRASSPISSRVRLQPAKVPPSAVGRLLEKAKEKMHEARSGKEEEERKPLQVQVQNTGEEILHDLPRSRPRKREEEEKESKGTRESVRERRREKEKEKERRSREREREARREKDYKARPLFSAEGSGNKTKRPLETSVSLDSTPPRQGIKRPEPFTPRKLLPAQRLRKKVPWYEPGKRLNPSSSPNITLTRSPPRRRHREGDDE